MTQPARPGSIPEAPAAAPTASGSSPTILLADDDLVARRMLELVLGSGGYHLVFADSGQQALRLAREVGPDLVLLDVNMPDIHGYDVCRQLRADPILAEVPVIMVTALTDRDARIRGIEAGADDFISKPFDHVELAARVRTITRLNRYRHVQEAQRLTQQVEMAAVIQQLLLPHAAPVIQSLETATRYRPASQVGGDYFDFIVLDGLLYFVVGDVSGHGLASALFMASGRSTLRALLPSTPHVLDLAEGINRRIVEDAADSGMFITVVVGCYDPRSRDLAVVNCGHPEPVLLHRSGLIECVRASSAPVGILDALNADAFISTLGDGDLLCLHTDGLIEAEGAGGELFGPERLHRVLTAHAGGSLDDIADAILAAVFAFRGHETLEDDLTLMLLRRRVARA